ncbi:MAG: hypothetical protein ACD_19C00160G0001, partial [uncultured bacterium]
DNRRLDVALILQNYRQRIAVKIYRNMACKRDSSGNYGNLYRNNRSLFPLQLHNYSNCKFYRKDTDYSIAFPRYYSHNKKQATGFFRKYFLCAIICCCRLFYNSYQPYGILGDMFFVPICDLLHKNYSFQSKAKLQTLYIVDYLFIPFFTICLCQTVWTPIHSYHY